MCLAYSMKDIQKTGGMIIIMDKNKQDRLNKQMRFIEEIDKEIEDFYRKADISIRCFKERK